MHNPRATTPFLHKTKVGDCLPPCACCEGACRCANVPDRPALVARYYAALQVELISLKRHAVSCCNFLKLPKRSFDLFLRLAANECTRSCSYLLTHTPCAGAASFSFQIVWSAPPLLRVQRWLLSVRTTWFPFPFTISIFSFSFYWPQFLLPLSLPTPEFHKVPVYDVWGNALTNSPLLSCHNLQWWRPYIFQERRLFPPLHTFWESRANSSQDECRIWCKCRFLPDPPSSCRSGLATGAVTGARLKKTRAPMREKETKRDHLSDWTRKECMLFLYTRLLSD